MSIVDVEHQVYHCPHCQGYIAIRLQYPYMETGCSVSLEHWMHLPKWLDKATKENIENVSITPE